MEEARVCKLMSYVVEARRWGKRVCASMYVMYVQCSGRTKMEEACVCTFLSCIGEARKLEKRVYVTCCKSTKMHLNVSILIYTNEDASTIDFLFVIHV
jgi:hypothetical protein